ncbi:tRNA (adenosine(37)-N6)-threonylcarbamoyltransferase complex dimerization subunit type 1 TsaB [Fundidesulfovibrio butyratiphilus]
MILAVGAAEERLQIVLGDQDGISLVFEEICPGRMNEVLAPATADLLDRAGLAPADLEAVACVRGPGSFTGVRLALAFCHGLAVAAGLPLAGLDYLPLLASSAARRFHADSGEIHVLTHSRLGKVYRQGFRLPDLTPLAPPSDEPAEESARHLAERATLGQVFVLGSGLARNANVLEKMKNVVRLDPAANTPDSETLLAAALQAPRTGPPVDALYLRGSDAEENLDAIARKRGLDPEEARKRLETALKKGERQGL